MEGNIATFQFFKLAYGNGTTCDGLIGVTEDVKARLERSKTTYFSTMDGLPCNWNEPMSNVVDMFSLTWLSDAGVLYLQGIHPEQLNNKRNFAFLPSVEYIRRELAKAKQQ